MVFRSSLKRVTSFHEHTKDPAPPVAIPFWPILACLIVVVAPLVVAALLAAVSGAPGLDSIGLPP